VALVFAALLAAAGAAVAAYALLAGPAASLLDAPRLLTQAAGQAPADYAPPQAVDGVYHRDFHWSYGGHDYAWTMDIPESSYLSYHALKRPMRTYVQNGTLVSQAAYDIAVSDPNDDAFIGSLAKALLDQSHRDGLSDDQALSMALAFVQSLPYTSDRVTTGFDDYARYPIETLVDNGGDCEDTAILYASLVLAMGYGAILVSPPGHMAVGVAADPGVDGTSYDVGGVRYLYAETTGDDWSLGEVPDEYKDQPVQVFDLTPKPLFSLAAQFGAVSSGHQELDLRATQTGSATATSVQEVATVGVDGGPVYDEAHCDAGTVSPGQTVHCTLSLDLRKVPRGQRVVLHAWVQDTQYRYDEVDSTPWVPRP